MPYQANPDTGFIEYVEGPIPTAAAPSIQVVTNWNINGAITYTTQYATSFDDFADLCIKTSKNPTRKKGQPMPRIKRTADKDKFPPAERRSVYAGVYPKSTEDQWRWYEGAGWVYKDEEAIFKDQYAKCDVSGDYFQHALLKRCMINDSIKLVCNRERKKLDLVACAHNGVFYARSLMIKAFDKMGSPCHVHKDIEQQSDHWMRDDITDELFHRSLRRKLYRNGEELNVMHTTIDSPKFVHCGNCGTYYDAPNGNEVNPVRVREDILNQHDGRICDRCYDLILTKTVIKPYNDKTYPKMICTSVKRWRVKEKKAVPTEFKARRLFGAEAELEVKDKTHLAKHAIILIKTLGPDFVLAKHDGSIKDPDGNVVGFELVTAPADLTTHRARWRAIESAENYTLLRSWDTTTCGFHVHVSREVLSALQIGRIQTFVNHPANKKFIEIVAGRSEQKYTKYYPKKLADSLRPIPGGNHDEKRRVAVNLCNEKTIEFRIFRGTINYQHMIRNIEFCDAVCDYCYPAGRSLRDMASAKKFTDFVLNEHEWDETTKQSVLKWPELVRWFRMHGVGEKKEQKGTLPPGHNASEQKPVAEAGDSPLDSIKRPSKSEHSMGILPDKSPTYASLRKEITKKAKKEAEATADTF